MISYDIVGTYMSQEACRIIMILSILIGQERATPAKFTIKVALDIADISY